jgi:hypothetical protein
MAAFLSNSGFNERRLTGLLLHSSAPLGDPLLRSCQSRALKPPSPYCPRTHLSLCEPRKLRVTLTCAFIAVLISGALIDLAGGGDLVECEPQRVTGDGRHWAYRTVDGRACWYPGRRGKPKNELFWDHGISASTHQPLDQPETEPEIERSEPASPFVAAPTKAPEIRDAMPEDSRAISFDRLLAFTCCWPELEEVAVLSQVTPKGGGPLGSPLALLPLALYALLRLRRGLHWLPVSPLRPPSLIVCRRRRISHTMALMSCPYICSMMPRGLISRSKASRKASNSSADSVMSNGNFGRNLGRTGSWRNDRAAGTEAQSSGSRPAELSSSR